MSSLLSTAQFSESAEDRDASNAPDRENVSSQESSTNDGIRGDALPPGMPLPMQNDTVASTAWVANHRDAATENAAHDYRMPALAAKSPIDLRMLDYVNACDENLICPICRCPFVDPVILVDCDHCFCRDCIRQTWTSFPSNPHSPNHNRKDCPSCRAPAKLGLRSSTNKILTNILDDMVVRCPHAADGCAAQMKRAEVQDHIALYCGYTMVECAESSCRLLCRRKDASKGCLHVDLCCMACHEQTQLADLDAHWLRSCRNREVNCEFCNVQTSYRDLARHQEEACPGITVPCPGKSLGCSYESERAGCNLHAETCPLATLMPIFAAQKKRLDEQETAQKHMHRRMKILENGFSTMRDILYPPMTTEGTSSSLNEPPQLRYGLPRDDAVHPSFDNPSDTSGFRPPAASTSTNYLDSFDLDHGQGSSFSNPASDGPYASPVHHLLSMHENLREEMSRISNALQELEGRQSLQILNENLRTREEMSYLGAQLASLTRQMHWLTSTQLQQQQTRVGTPSARNADDIAAAGASVGAAVSAVNNAVRGAARIVNGGREGMGNRRGSSEEGRTKL